LIASKIFFSLLFGIILLVPPLGADAFETEGVSTAIIGDFHTAGEPIHQEITKDGLKFLKSPVSQLLADQHPTIELDQSSPNHFDNCQFTESVSLINSRYDNAVIFLNPNAPNLDSARTEFGKILHTVQDFYSHTNWIEMGRTDLVDPWYDHWKPLTGYSSTTNEDPVFVLEQRPNGIFSDYTISKKDKTFTVNHELWDTTGEGKKSGLISGTYGEPHESHCPPDASIPHGDKLYNRFFRTADYTEFPNELNKDNPAIKGHKAARTLATEQTTHEFCRLVVLTNEKWGMPGVNLIYNNWVADKAFLDKRCPTIEESYTSIRSGNDSYIHDSNQNYISKPNSVEDKPSIPDWFKSNAKWWKQGLISDGDIINALESLIIQDVIPLDKFVTSHPGLEHEAGVPKGGTFIIINEKPKIPAYQKDVFGFWSDGQVSDSEIVNSIGHLMSQGIISSEKIQTEISERQEKISNSDDAFRIEGHLGKEADSTHTEIEKSRQDFSLPFDVITQNQLIQIESNILIANNLSLEQILGMQNFLISSLDDSTEQAWKLYAENKNTDYMNNAIDLEKKLNEIKSDSIQTVQSIEDSRQITDSFFDVAENYGFDIFMLQTTAEQNLPLLDAPSKIRTVTDLENAEKYVKKFDNFIQTNVDLSDSIIESGLSQNTSYGEPFSRTGLEDAPSREYGIDSRSGATVCEDDNVCNSDKGEVCAKRTGETEGKCIPTWFGISHAWAPIASINSEDIRTKYHNVDDLFVDENGEKIIFSPLEHPILDSESTESSNSESTESSNSESTESSEPESTVENESEMEEFVLTKALYINTISYPISQFTLWKWIGECDDSWHYHTATGHAVSTSLNGIGDPDPDNCGFGKVGEIGVQDVWMPKSMVDAFHELTGIDPLVSEAQMGGSGP